MKEKRQKRDIETGSSNPKYWASGEFRMQVHSVPHPPSLKGEEGWLLSPRDHHPGQGCLSHHRVMLVSPQTVLDHIVVVSTSVTKSPVALDKLCSLCGPHVFQKRRLDRPPAFFPALISFDSKKALSLVSCKDQCVY